MHLSFVNNNASRVSSFGKMRERDPRVVEIGERVKALRVRAGIPTQVALAKRAGLDEGFVSQLESGTVRSFPKLETLQKLARVMRCSVSQLIGETSIPEPTLVDEPDIRDLLKNLESVPVDLRKQLSPRLGWFAERLREREAESTALVPVPRDTRLTITFEEEEKEMSDEEIEHVSAALSNVVEFRRGRRWKAREVPLVGVVSIGRGIEIQEHYEKLRQIPDFYWDAGARAAVKAVGVSMWDMGITHNDLLYFRPAETAQHEDTILFTLNGKAYCKEFHYRGDKITLQSAHPGYEPMTVAADDDFRIFGIVVGRSGIPPKRRQIEHLREVT